MRREETAALGLLILSFSFVFLRLCFPDHKTTSPSLPDSALRDEDAIALEFRKYASSVLNDDQPTSSTSRSPSPSSNGTALTLGQLGHLFSDKTNLSLSQLEAASVWKHLKRLALRSDLFSMAKEAILEGVAAWDELLETLSSTTKVEDDGLGPHCIYSTVNNSNRKLDTPCGLSLDSSITLAAVPGASFRIRLLNSSQPGDSILDYYVQLGNFSTPVIVQTTGNATFQETCPSLTKTVKKVDKLDACFIRSSRKDSGGRKRAPSAGGDFPFTVGLPFVATLRLGQNGFHMSVNGKHVTSLRYVKGLKLWTVDSIEVQGHADVLSFMATGLPVSGKHKHLPEVEYLKAPEVSRTPTIFIGVFSTAGNLERRMAIRRSWMQYSQVRSGDVVVRFFVGLDKSSEVNLELWTEAMSYKDMQLLPLVDHYEVITVKTLAICLYGVKISKAQFLMKTDDDTFVRIDEVLSLVKHVNPNTAALHGLIEFSAEPNRDENSKWFISVEEWPRHYYPPWPHGAGYLISRELGKHVVKSYEKQDLKLFKLEDVAMGIWINDYVGKGKRVEYINNDRFFNLQCGPGYVIAHYQEPKQMLCLWQHLKAGRGPVCCN